MAVVSLVSRWAMPVLILGIPVYGWIKGVRVYGAFVEGAEEGLGVAVRILPYLVAIFFATTLFRASGAMSAIAGVMGPVLERAGVPNEVLPLLILKPLSGGASLAFTIDLMKRLGADSFPAFLACVSQGSFDTTFYVVGLYFGSVGVRSARHTILAALIGDFVGFAVAVAVCRSATVASILGLWPPPMWK